jgi:uncharacterized protein (TIGR02646 family)
MKKIEKKEPSFFTEFIHSEKPESWNDMREIKYRIRQHMLRNEQNQQCAYTEIRINPDSTVSHIDHYLKQEWYKDSIFDYHNLFTSCNSEFFAAKHKDKRIEIKDYNNLINPSIEDPADYFEYTMNGFIVAKDPNNIKAETTIRLFNLNHRTLTERRKEKIHFLQRWAKYYSLEMLMMEIGEFDSMIVDLYPQLQKI